MRRLLSGRRLWLVAALVTLALAAVASSFASNEPDGLERTATDQGFDDTAEQHDLADGPLADYRVDGVDDDRLAVGLAGAAGVAVTLTVGAGLFWLVRKPGGRGSDGHGA